jgi:hypothetical protein
VHIAGGTQVAVLKSSMYVYGATVPPSAAQPGWAAWGVGVPVPQQIVPGVPAQSAVPSQCQSLSLAQAVAVGSQVAVPDEGSQQCWVPAVQ